MLYGNLRWPDVKALDKDRVVVVCPIASLEQHGHHLPLLTDTILVTGVAERVHAKLGDRIALTPTLWLGASDHHIDFPGTISVPNSLYVEMIKNMVRSLVRGGFRRIFFLNGHGGNVAPGEVAITEMANACDDCDRANIALASYWSIAEEAIAADKHGMTTPKLTHACEYETSMVLYLSGELVKMEAAKGAGDANVFPPGGARYAGRFRRRTSTGALGSPEHATAEKGESLLTAIADEVAPFLEDFATWPFREEIGPA